MRDREPDYLTDQAAAILHEKLVAFDNEIDIELGEIASANAMITEAGIRVDALWPEREKLARELSKRTRPDWTPPSTGLAAKSSRDHRFYRKRPLPGVVVLPRSRPADEDDI